MDKNAWLENKKVELQNGIDDLLKNSSAAEKEVLIIMKELAMRLKIKETK